MKKILILLATLLHVSCSIPAQSSKKDKIKELLIVTHQDSIIMKKFRDMSSPPSANYSDDFSDSTALKIISTYVTDTTQLNNMKEIMKDSAYLSLIGSFKNIYSSKAKTDSEEIKKLAINFINVDLVDIYDKKFSIDEVDELILFYKTNVGQKSLSLMPEVQNEADKKIKDKYATYMQAHKSK